jgi:hypothetical protein
VELSWSNTYLPKSAVRYYRIKFQHVLHGVINQSCMTCCLVAYIFPGGFSYISSFHPFIKCFCTLLLSAMFVAPNLVVHCFPVSCLAPVGFPDHVVKFMEISSSLVYIMWCTFMLSFVTSWNVDSVYILLPVLARIYLFPYLPYISAFEQSTALFGGCLEIHKCCVFTS